MQIKYTLCIIKLLQYVQHKHIQIQILQFINYGTVIYLSVKFIIYIIAVAVVGGLLQLIKHNSEIVAWVGAVSWCSDWFVGDNVILLYYTIHIALFALIKIDCVVVGLVVAVLWCICSFVVVIVGINIFITSSSGSNDITLHIVLFKWV